MLSNNHIVKAFSTIHPVQSQVQRQHCPSGCMIPAYCAVCNIEGCLPEYASCLEVSRCEIRVLATCEVGMQGYVVYSRKLKLRPELAGLPNNEIRDRRLAGEVS